MPFACSGQCNSPLPSSFHIGVGLRGFAKYRSKAMMLQKLTRSYALQPTRKTDAVLDVDFYFPETDQPTDLLVWIAAGGFRSGSRVSRMNVKIAEGFARHGYASAFIDHRDARPFAVLQDTTEAKLEALEADAKAAGEEMAATLYGTRALAAVEDVCVFLRYVDAAREEFALTGRYVLGGSSSGAITALNTLYLPEHLGIERPDIATVLAFSGGFAYPSYISETGGRILAINGPEDTVVPISSIRRLAARVKDRCLLIESEGHAHGAISVAPEEPLDDAIDRCVAFDRTDSIATFDIWQGAKV